MNARALYFAVILALAVAETSPPYASHSTQHTAVGVAADAAAASSYMPPPDKYAYPEAAYMKMLHHGQEHAPPPGEIHPPSVQKMLLQATADEFHANLDHNKDGLITVVRGYCLLLYP
jgi:hypothetical protein